MKYYILVVLLIKLSISNAQNDLTNTSSLNKEALQVEMYDVSMKKIPYGAADVEGSPMLNKQFVNGIVKFKTGEQYSNVRLNLSLTDNQLYFMRDSVPLQFLNPVEYFALPTHTENAAVFKSGYPSIGNNSQSTFYEVISEGAKLQLLKFSAKKLNEIYTYNSPAKKVYSLREDLYIYDVLNAKIFELPTKPGSFKNYLPAYTSYVDAYTLHNKLNLKSEKEVAELINYINGQLK